nr:hypothetical protein [Brevundimonas sp. UBA5936]
MAIHNFDRSALKQALRGGAEPGQFLWRERGQPGLNRATARFRHVGHYLPADGGEMDEAGAQVGQLRAPLNQAIRLKPVDQPNGPGVG